VKRYLPRSTFQGKVIGIYGGFPMTECLQYSYDCWLRSCHFYLHLLRRMHSQIPYFKSSHEKKVSREDSEKQPLSHSRRQHWSGRMLLTTDMEEGRPWLPRFERPQQILSERGWTTQQPPQFQFPEATCTPPMTNFFRRPPFFFSSATQSPSH